MQKIMRMGKMDGGGTFIFLYVGNVGIDITFSFTYLVVPQYDLTSAARPAAGQAAHHLLQ